MMKSIKSDKYLTEPIYKVPLCLQDAIPIYRIAENGIFELERKKGLHQFDRVYLFEDINYSTQDEEDKARILEKFKKMLNSMNVSYKISVSNHYTNNKKLREAILHKAVTKEKEPLAKEYHELISDKLSEGRKGIEQSKYFIISCRMSDFESARNYFATIEFSILQFFRSFGSGLIPLDATERLRALHSFYRMGEEETFDFNWNEYVKLKRDWRNDIVNTSIKPHKEYLELEQGRAISTMFIKKYASGVSDQFMRELTNVSFPLTVTMDCEPLENEYANALVMKKYMNNERSIISEQEKKNKNGDFSSNISYEKRRQQEELEEVLDEIRSFDERLFYMGITITLMADSRQELEERMERVKIIGKSYNMVIVPHSFNQLEAFNTTLPTGGRFVETMRTMKTDSLSIFAPFNVQEIIEKDGFFYGVNEVTKNVIIGNRKKLKNGNGFVFGVPGSGKSFDEKMEMGQVAAFTNDDIIVVDPMGEYRVVAERWGGQYINLSQSESNIYNINPFHVPGNISDKDKFIAEKAEFAYAICEQAIKPTPLTSRHIAVIDRAVRKMYEEHFSSQGKMKKRKSAGVASPTIRTMRDLIFEETQQNEAAKELVEQLEVFVDGTLDIFSRGQTASERNRFKVYGFSELGNRLSAMAMLIMIESITSQIKYNQSEGIATWVYVDEIHRLWDDSYALLAIQRLWREVRKRGGICTGMIQNVIDSQRNRETKTMVSNSEFTILLDQGVMDRDAVEDIFEISENQVSFVNGAKKGGGLIRFGKKIVPFDNTVSKRSDLYNLFNTDFHEMNKEDKEGGDDAANGL